jgi:hypothetical protein
MSGDGPLAVKFADNLRAAFPAASFANGGLAPSEGRGYVIYGRFAPDRMMTMADPGADRAPAQVLYHYGRGEALAGKHDEAGVRREEAAITGTTPQATIARAVLTGRADMLAGDFGRRRQRLFRGFRNPGPDVQRPDGSAALVVLCPAQRRRGAAEGWRLC